MTTADAFSVASGQGRYHVEPFEGIDGLIAEIARIDRAAIVADERVVELFAEPFRTLGAALIHRVAATEREKTLAGVERTLLALQAAGANKKTVVVGVGGGIVQDVAALASHLWYRGVEFVFVPTTLLAMADSCIGAKSAVNLGAFKNQIGTFQAPSRVLVCPRFVDTLADDDVRSGYGEIVKLAIIDSAQRFFAVRDDVEGTGFRGPHLGRNIRASLETKRRIIEIDEYERDLRRILNYGHTFGHALESVTGNGVPHGIAVAWGVDVANFVAMRKNILDEATYAEIHRFLKAAFALKLPAAYDVPQLIAAMRRDKKAHDGTIDLILPYGFGDVRVVPAAIDAELESQIGEYLRSDDIFGR
jgi:3-dehydroquinate synthase